MYHFVENFLLSSSFFFLMFLPNDEALQPHTSDMPHIALNVNVKLKQFFSNKFPDLTGHSCRNESL